MKIIWIVPEFQTGPANPSLAALTELAHRVAREHTLKIFALLQPDREAYYRVGRVEIRAFQHPGNSKFSRMALLNALVKAVWEISHEPGEIVHAFWANGPVLAGLTANFLYKRPLIVTHPSEELGVLAEGAAKQQLNRFCLDRAVSRATITTGSETQAGLLKAHYPRLKPVVLPLGGNCIQLETGTENSLEICAGRIMRLYHEVFIRGLKKRV